MNMELAADHIAEKQGIYSHINFFSSNQLRLWFDNK